VLLRRARFLSTIESILLRASSSKTLLVSSLVGWHRIASQASLFFAVFCLLFFPPPLITAVCLF
jgi:hypothetical protein